MVEPRRILGALRLSLFSIRDQEDGGANKDSHGFARRSKRIRVFNNHARANAAANAIMLLQELGQDVRPGEALLSKFPELGM